MSYKSDVAVAKKLLANLPTDWDGKQSVLELKAANYNWRQMEWWGFYFEHLCRQKLNDEFKIPGDAISLTRANGRKTVVRFDAKRGINWDFKSKAIKSDDHRAILNDQAAMDLSIEQHKQHGLIVALCDVEYNDADRTFQKWHTQLKGGKSQYEIAREQRTSVSRYRKTRAVLTEILFLIIHSRNVRHLEIYHQGRNSDGTPRPPKYMLNLEDADRFLVDKLGFEKLM